MNLFCKVNKRPPATLWGTVRHDLVNVKKSSFKRAFTSRSDDGVGKEGKGGMGEKGGGEVQQVGRKECQIKENINTRKSKCIKKFFYFSLQISHLNKICQSVKPLKLVEIVKYRI